jgi:hypothetical protein
MKATQVLIYTVLFSAVLQAVVASANVASRRRVPPKLTFFCEVDPVNIPLLSDQAVISALTTLNATVSVTIRDFSVERANYIRLLNQHNITASAWLAVDYSEGYWANINNAPQFVAAYSQFKSWTQQYGLKWDAVGLDLEVDFREVAPLAQGDLTPFITAATNRLINPQQLSDAKAVYTALANQIRADGFRVESYIFPFIYDERRANSQLLELLLGLVDVTAVDNEIPLLYTSGLPLGLGFLKSYGKGLKSVAVGTAGGDPLNATVPTQYPDFAALDRDLRYAHQVLNSENIYIYSLPGLVFKGWLQNIVNFNWNRALTLRQRAAYEIEGALVDATRVALQALLSAARVPTGASSWLAENDFSTFTNILDFLFDYLGWQ